MYQYANLYPYIKYVENYVYYILWYGHNIIPIWETTFLQLYSTSVMAIWYYINILPHIKLQTNVMSKLFIFDLNM